MQAFIKLLNDQFKGFTIQAVNLNIFHYILAVLFGLLFAWLIRIIYKKAYRGTMFNNSMASSLSIVLIVTTFVTMAISVQPALSIGMIGALSIVRFRTAVKDAMDIAYMFWAISLGITLGAGLFILAVLLFIIVAVALVFLKRTKSKPESYLLVVTCSPAAEDRDILDRLAKTTANHKIKSQSVDDERKELTIEIELKASASHLIADIKAVSSVRSAVLLSYDGDYVA